MFDEFLNLEFWGNLLSEYVYFAALFLAGLFAVKLFSVVVLRKVRAFADKTKSSLDDLLCDISQRAILPVLYFGVFYFSLKTLKIPEYLYQAVQILGTAVVTIGVAKISVILMEYGLNLHLRRRGVDEALGRSLKGIKVISKFLIWGLAIVFFLDNMGFQISAVIAGLGIGGVAVALAAQAVLGDLFSYFAILFDRPFEIGDFVIVGEYLGTIEKVGIKTTHIRSLGGEQLVFSNTDLTNSRIRNYKRMEKRRVVFKIGVTYQTGSHNLARIPQIIKDIIAGIEDTVFDRAHFGSYGDFSLNFEIVYYVIGADYNKYMDVQQAINLRIKEEMEKIGVQFAYPTQTVFIEKS